MKRCLSIIIANLAQRGEALHPQMLRLQMECIVLPLSEESLQ
jgi:hypothetical protein